MESANDIKRRSIEATDALKQLWKIGGIKIDIFTTVPEYHQHDNVSGRVRISISESQEPLFCETLSLELDEYWPVKTGNGGDASREYKTLKSVLLAGKFHPEPGSVSEFSFNIELPRNCTITRNGNGLQLYARMDIPDVPLLNPNKAHDLKILPAREFIAVIQTLKENMGFKESLKGRARIPLLSWNRKSSSLYLRFKPPKAVGARIKYLGLELSQTVDSGVKGNLTFETPYKSVLDHIGKSLFQHDESKPFYLQPADIFLADGRPNREAIIAVVGSLIW